MANAAILLSDPKTGRCSFTVQAWLLRFWEVKNVRRGGELMGVATLLLDSQVCYVPPLEFFLYLRLSS